MRCATYMISFKLSTGSIVRPDPKNQARRRDHADFVRKSRERIAKFPEFRRALRRKNCVRLANVRCTNPVTSLQLSVKSMVCSDPKKCASDVEIMKKLRKNFAKELQNFRNFGAPCSQNLFFSANIICATHTISLKLSDGSTVSADLKKQARGVKIAQMRWENPANEMQN